MKDKMWIFLFLFFISSASCEKNSGGGDPLPQPPTVPVNTFTNPLLTSGPDPWIIKKDNFYYYTHTLGNRIAIWKTAKVSELKNAPVVNVWTAPATGPNSKNVWAPELHFLNNKWYIYYTAGSTTDLATQRTFVLENSNADPTTGSWIDKGKIGDPNADFFSIDGSVLEYGGKLYFLWSGQESEADKTQRLYIAEMSNPWTLQTSRTQIASPQYPWESMGAPPAVNEGPQILKNPAGRVFLIYSASGCWTDDYALGMITLKEGGDPLNASDWTKSSSPVFSKNPGGSVFGPGHNSFFKSPDGTEDWILYHANPQSGQGCGDKRSPRMQKFTWNPDGTPNFGTPVPINSNITKPSGE
ncbi:MAG: glycoside hydrolase family 43 protein [Chitinophagaceae bacterium]